MKVAVSATGPGLEAPTSPQFGRCACFVIVDTETMAAESIPNPAIGASGGAGIQAAQLMADSGVRAVVSGAFGPNAYQALAAAGVSMFTFGAGTVRQAVEAYRAGQLTPVSAATSPAHSGTGAPAAPWTGRGMGRGMGQRGGRGRFGPGG